MARFNKARLKLGDWCRIRFWDHRSNDDDVREYFVCGRVHRISIKAIVIDSWALIDPESADRDPGETCENFSLLRKATVEIVRMVDENILKNSQSTIDDLHELLNKRDEKIATLEKKIDESNAREITLRKQIKIST